jgi:hypothetical protein
MLHEYFPEMNCLSPEQLNDAYSALLPESWYAHDTLIKLDPDELNDTRVLYNLEDYEFEPLLQWRGPEALKNKQGNIIGFNIEINRPNPDQIPALCSQCKRCPESKELNILCSVNRFEQRNTENFKCFEFEKK